MTTTQKQSDSVVEWSSFTLIALFWLETGRLQCSMGWFPSLICKNYVFKHFVKTVEATSLKFCTKLKLVTLHLKQTIAQAEYANYSNAHAQIFVLLKANQAFTLFFDCAIIVTLHISMRLFLETM